MYCKLVYNIVKNIIFRLYIIIKILYKKFDFYLFLIYLIKFLLIILFNMSNSLC